MGWSNGNGNFNQNNNNQGGGQEGIKPKSNFRVGKIYGSDGICDISIWKSEKGGGVYGILSIKSAVGKDPSNGGNVYEQKMTSELPSIFLNAELLRAIVEYTKNKEVSTIDMLIDTKRNSKLTIKGSAAEVRMTIENQKTGSRTITIPAISVGMDMVHANFLNMIDFIDICLKKAIRNKLDPNEFGMVVGGDESSEGSSADDSPF